MGVKEAETHTFEECELEKNHEAHRCQHKGFNQSGSQTEETMERHVDKQTDRHANRQVSRAGRQDMKIAYVKYLWKDVQSVARLAQSAERKALNLVVVGSSPTVGASSLKRIKTHPPS